MLSRIARVIVPSALIASSALAQGTPATSSAIVPGQFQTGVLYAGPRVWLGNLNGAIAVGGQAERGLTPAGKYGSGIIAGGVGVDYYTWSFKYPTGKYSYSVVPLQAFGNYHFVMPDHKRFDPYLGLALVYSVVNASWSGSGIAASANGSGLDFAGQAGLRYFMTDKVALQGQLGFGYGTLGVGATWRF